MLHIRKNSPSVNPFEQTEPACTSDVRGVYSSCPSLPIRSKYYIWQLNPSQTPHYHTSNNADKQSKPAKTTQESILRLSEGGRLPIGLIGLTGEIGRDGGSSTGDAVCTYIGGAGEKGVSLPGDVITSASIERRLPGVWASCGASGDVC